MASAAKFTCSGDGSDCPCHSKEKSRPPAAPVTTGPVKITLAPGEAKYLCKCGESKNYVREGEMRRRRRRRSRRRGEEASSPAARTATNPARPSPPSVTRVPQPFCDGSHKGSEAAKALGLIPSPLKNDTAEPKDFYVCTCGHTKKEDGCCDGSHKAVKSA